MRRILILFVSMLAMAWAISPSFSEDKNMNDTWGPGLTSCSTFEKIYSLNPKPTEALYFAWGQGFMSGLNVMMTAQHRPTTNLGLWDMDRAQQFVRQYCTDHPSETYGHAIIQLFNSLRAAQGVSNK